MSAQCVDVVGSAVVMVCPGELPDYGMVPYRTYNHLSYDTSHHDASRGGRRGDGLRMERVLGGTSVTSLVTSPPNHQVNHEKSKLLIKTLT